MFLLLFLYFFFSWSDAKDYHLIALQPGILARPTLGYEAFTLKIIRETQLMRTSWKCESERSLAFISTSPTAGLLSYEYVHDCAPNPFTSWAPQPQLFLPLFPGRVSGNLTLRFLHSSVSSAQFSLLCLRIVSFCVFELCRSAPSHVSGFLLAQIINCSVSESFLCSTIACVAEKNNHIAIIALFFRVFLPPCARI